MRTSTLRIWALIHMVLLSVAALPGRAQTHNHTTLDWQTIGRAHFPLSCTAEGQQPFDKALAMLHAFWYEEAEKAFRQVVATDPGCAMGYWGIAMSHYHQLWSTPTGEAALRKGLAAIEKAKNLEIPSQRERDYLKAIEAFYRDHDVLDHATRKRRYEQAMEQVYTRHPDDPEAAVFYALALLSTASPKDTTYTRQVKALALLNDVLAAQPEHPGVAHYIIHSADTPRLASLGLEAARTYARIAPSVPHALHMPSHIFVRLGLWQEAVQANRAAERAARRYARRTFPGRAWDQQLHAMDYKMYAHLQMGQYEQARAILDDVRAIRRVHPENVTAAYALAALPARYAVERGRWGEAAALPLHPATFPWQQAPWSEALVHFARGLGAARTGDLSAARRSLNRLETLRDAARAATDPFGADQIEIQRLSVSAWIALAEKKEDEAEKRMRAAADREDALEKGNVTPGPIKPARELLGDLLLELERPKDALHAFEASLQRTPNRWNGLYGAARAAERGGDTARAKQYDQQRLAVQEAGRVENPAIE